MVHKKLCIVGVHTLMLEFGDPGLLLFFFYLGIEYRKKDTR